MPKITKSELNNFLKKVPSTVTKVVKMANESMVVEFKHCLTPEEAAAFVNAVAENIQIDGVIYRGLFDFYFRLQAIAMFTNAQIPSKGDDQAKLAYCAGIYESINSPQLSALREACQQKVEDNISIQNALLRSAVAPDPIESLVRKIEDVLAGVQSALTGENILPTLAKIAKEHLVAESEQEGTAYGSEDQVQPTDKP